jgi:hypothetical protein
MRLSAVATPVFGLHQVQISKMPFLRLRQLAKGLIMAIPVSSVEGLET